MFEHELEAEFYLMDIHSQGQSEKSEEEVNPEPTEDPEESDEFILPAIEFEAPGLLPSPHGDLCPRISSASTSATSTTPPYHQRLLHEPTEFPQYPLPTRPLYSIFHPNTTPFLPIRRPQMPRAPHIELRGSQRLSPANPTSMAVETRHATVTSPIRPQWDPHPSIKMEGSKDASYSKFDRSGGAFKPLHKHRQQSSPSPPSLQPKTVSVTVIQPNTSCYTRASETSAISGTVTSSGAEPVRNASRSPGVSERISTPREGYMPSYPAYAVDPTYSLHVAVECHRATQQDSDGDTPLHIAISQADEIEMSLIRHLISLVAMSGRSVDIFNYIQQTPLHIAVITDNADITRLLLEAGANPNETDRNGLTAVHHACVNNSIVCLKTILDSSKFTVDMNARNYNGFAPIHATVMDNNMEMTNALLASGASVEVQDAKNGWSPLFHAVINQNQTMITRLIEAGAKVNAQSYSANTALHVATGRGYTDVVRLLMRYGADMSVKNTHRDTPVMMSSNKMISNILQGKGPVPSQGRSPVPSQMPYHSAPLRVPTRPHVMASQHPLSLAESLHPHRLPPAPKPGPQAPLSLVKHRRQSPPKRRGRVSHAPVGPSPLTYPSQREQSENLTSPKKLIVDEAQSSSSVSPSSPPKNLIIDEAQSTSSVSSSSPQQVKSEESTPSCRVSVIVQRQPSTKDEQNTRTSFSDEKKPSERMPLVSQMLRETGDVSSGAATKSYALQALPDSASSSGGEASREESREEQMPILEPVSPMEAKPSDSVEASKAPQLASTEEEEKNTTSTEDKDISRESSTSSEPPLSPAIEMSDGEDEPMAVSPVSPKRSHEDAFGESSDKTKAKDGSGHSDEKEKEEEQPKSKRLRKDSNDNVPSPSHE